MIEKHKPVNKGSLCSVPSLLTKSPTLRVRDVYVSSSAAAIRSTDARMDKRKNARGRGWGRGWGRRRSRYGCFTNDIVFDSRLLSILWRKLSQQRVHIVIAPLLIHFPDTTTTSKHLLPHWILFWWSVSKSEVIDNSYLYRTFLLLTSFFFLSLLYTRTN